MQLSFQFWLGRNHRRSHGVTEEIILQICANMVTTHHMCLLSTWNVVIYAINVKHTLEFEDFTFKKGM